jgi:hypothetical protein
MGLARFCCAGTEACGGSCAAAGFVEIDQTRKPAAAAIITVIIFVAIMV